MSNKIIKGTMMLTGAAFLSKFLGMIYVIPFNEIVGYQGMALYYYAYNPYTILISISTIGIPLAVSKIVSRYNSLGYYDTGIKVFKASLILMVVTGFMAFLILYFGSEWFAARFTDEDMKGNSIADVAKVMRMVSFALLVIPGMSVFRGFLQGNEMMHPTAISQVVEQIVRVVFVLVSAYLIISVYNESITLAVSYATFAALIGALASCVVLLRYWRQIKPQLDYQRQAQEKKLNISMKSLSIELLSYAGPFVLVGIAIPLYQAVDSFTFNKAMVIAGYKEIAELALATINMNGHKLISIPITIATGLSLTIVPALTSSFTNNDWPKLNKEINQALQIVLLLVIPSIVGLSALAPEAYGALFGMENLSITGNLLAWYAPVALLFALYTVTAAILQGVNEQRFALVSLAAGFLIKLICNSVFIHMIGAKGSIFATSLAVIVAVSLNLIKIYRSIEFNFIQTLKRTLFMVIFSGVMLLVIVLLKFGLHFVLPFDTSRIAAAVMLGIGVILGAAVYLYLTYKSTLLDFVLGDTNILSRFRRKSHAD